MERTNKEIYELYIVLLRNPQIAFCKTAYAAYKTLASIKDQGTIIEKFRLSLIKEYGKETGNGNYTLNTNDIPEEATHKLEDLFNEETEVNIYKVSKETFDSDVEKLITENGVSIGDCDVLERWLVDEPVQSSDDKDAAEEKS